jgi:isochorismate synthase
MAPFFEGSKILMPNNESEEIIVAVSFKAEEMPTANRTETGSDADTSFVNLVSKAVDAIENGQFSKVVLSRSEKVSIENFDAVAIFERLARMYQDAFTYCWFHPKVGMWLGATPELLVQNEGSTYRSVALAGTRTYNGTTDIKWENKEQDEQQFVTDYIIESLRGISSEIVVSSPYTARAGNLNHIKSDVEVVVKEGVELSTVVTALHPTPAVCGVPKQQAVEFILNNEDYQREFYSGYLGELNIDDKTELFVNLRCMKVVDGAATLFVGAGITKDSDPYSEYIETANKSMTLKRILK